MDVSKFVLNNETINIKDASARSNISTMQVDVTNIKSDITNIKSDLNAINNYEIAYSSSTETITIAKQ